MHPSPEQHQYVSLLCAGPGELNLGAHEHGHNHVPIGHVAGYVGDGGVYVLVVRVGDGLLGGHKDDALVIDEHRHDCIPTKSVAWQVSNGRFKDAGVQGDQSAF